MLHEKDFKRRLLEVNGDCVELIIQYYTLFPKVQIWKKAFTCYQGLRQFDKNYSQLLFYRFRLFMFLVLHIPAFHVPGFTDSGFSCSWFYRFRLFMFLVLQIPAFHVPGFTDSGFSCSCFSRSSFPSSLRSPIPRSLFYK